MNSELKSGSALLCLELGAVLFVEVNHSIHIFDVLNELSHIGQKHTLIKVWWKVRMTRFVPADSAELEYLLNFNLNINI